MKTTTILAFLVVASASLVTAQQYFEDERGFIRTNLCDGGAGQGASVASRRKRQAGGAKLCWFPADESIKNADDCKAASSTRKCASNPIYRPLGQYNICTEFVSRPGRWYFTEGSNGYCNHNEQCCEWYPRHHCNPLKSVLLWFEKPADKSCDDPEAKQLAKGSVAILQGQQFDVKTVCVDTREDKSQGEPLFEEKKVELTNCSPNDASTGFNGCCIFNFFS